MESPKNSAVTPSIRVKDIEKSLDWYTKTLGFRTTNKLVLKDGHIAHVAVGFDSPVLMLAPVSGNQTHNANEDLSKNKLGLGVEFNIGMIGSKKLDQFFTEVKAKGVTVVNEPKTEYWGDRIFTLKDPDGYAITFSEHVNDVTPEAQLTAYESAHQK
jgi:uncharacterized glyoxalase superfamily protein PhnB